MSEPTITSARIVHPPADISTRLKENFFQARVLADFTDGTTNALVLEYYDDELHFSEHEFIGLTQNDVHQLFHKKDVAYIRS